MVRYSKKSFDDITEAGTEAVRLHRNQRKSRVHKLAIGAGHNRREDRSGWAYAKRRIITA